MKITYATMTGDRMDDVHRELDRAIELVQATFGQSYPLIVGGRDVRAASEFDDRSPIDTRILLGRFQSAGREQVREADRRRQGGLSRLERASRGRSASLG